ncbi:MAG: hypothetical protein JWN44_3480 [Myxococcales bacterium]|nr:hypothetical protein [Myxococcales bacterium]
MTRLLSTAVLCAVGCTGQNVIGTNFVLSNGVSLMSGTATNQQTTLSGSCTVEPDVGRISCDGLTIRLNTPGVWQGIGWELRAPVAASCTGSSVPAPKIAVFSFGSLLIAPNTTVKSPTQTAVALIAADTVTIRGAIFATPPPSPGLAGASLPPYGVSPGQWVTTSPWTEGAGGAGGATAGAAGGNNGAQGGDAVPAQFDPMCGGSSGGAVGTYSVDDMGGGGGSVSAVQGNGGGALLVAAGNRIEFDGSAGGMCGVVADGSEGGSNPTGPGAGGGSGGVVLVESPTVKFDGSCGGLYARGGRGGTSNFGNGPPGGAGGGSAPPAVGADGNLGGRGGGAGGFIRVRAKACPAGYGTSAPTPTCIPLT